MNKCIFCDKEFIEHSKDTAKEVGLKLEKSNNNLLAILYPHIFKYCPNCKVVDLDLSDEEKEIVKGKKKEIFAIINNPELAEIDKDYVIRQAEVSGYICEILKDNVGAVLGYKSASDMLGVFINEFLDESTKNVLNKDGRSFRLLDSNKMKVFEYAKTRRDLLNRLVFAKYDNNTCDDMGMLGVMIFADTLLDLSDLESKSNNILSMCKKMIDGIRPYLEKDKSEFLPVLDEIENKYLLKVKYNNEQK